jgi:hypothetical protein
MLLSVRILRMAVAGRLTHAVNIFPAGYEFESGGMVIA